MEMRMVCGLDGQICCAVLDPLKTRPAPKNFKQYLNCFECAEYRPKCTILESGQTIHTFIYSIAPTNYQFSGYEEHFLRN